MVTPDDPESRGCDHEFYWCDDPECHGIMKPLPWAKDRQRSTDGYPSVTNPSDET